MNNPPPEEMNISNEMAATLESSSNQSQTESNSQEPLLPRSAWNSQLAYLRLVFRAKKALDRIEKETGVFTSN
ncbi:MULTISPECIES: hypothetical protein [unclassified Nodularia (in: cyanobacteria)]|uniref:hypothetical protein n=1 Tax=unclassified Nodularia (in: cyanobacteria) TaxID=2656917 RepID=UPI00187E600E|nr:MULTISPECIES: hypothetical protein [unclassified Nodularia (in: cyanobacteria)]MBE9197511.1 hypothetical protein [Nodularia sp. LEGE 06071]MCC2694376.1 hypothetical protein [Nodularia sp. LEGE 04288]